MYSEFGFNHLKKPMKYTFYPLKSLFFATSLFVSYITYAFDSTSIEEQANTSINELYHTLNAMPNTSMSQRIVWISEQFKGKIYVLGSLGEGPNARYDQFPRYRTDGFDCDTYVTTVLSLACANSLQKFQQCLKLIRYKNGNVTYLNRNHFTSIDFNKNNQQRRLLKDITLDIKDKQNKTVAVYAIAQIDKSGWYAHKSIETIRLQKGNDRTEQEKRLIELKNKGSSFKITPSKIAYIPFTALFQGQNKPNMYLFSQIPQGAIIEIIRPNWNLHKLIGTNLNVSHLGFAIWNRGTLYFRQASSQYGKVLDVPLIKYLQEAQKNPTIKGINVQIVEPIKDC